MSEFRLRRMTPSQANEFLNNMRAFPRLQDERVDNAIAAVMIMADQARGDIDAIWHLLSLMYLAAFQHGIDHLAECLWHSQDMDFDTLQHLALNEIVMPKFHALDPDVWDDFLEGLES